jgi:hypothetical protein
LLSNLAPIQVPVNDVLFGFLSAQQFRGLGQMVDRIVACGDRAISLLDYLSDSPIQGGPTSGSAALETKAKQRSRR